MFVEAEGHNHRVRTDDQRLIRITPAEVGPTDAITNPFNSEYKNYFVVIGNKIVNVIILMTEEIKEVPEDCETDAFLSRQARMASLLAMALRCPETD